MTEFRILGSLEVSREGRNVPLGGTRQRALLAILLLHRGEAVPIDRLVDELWGERPPDTATKTVQVYVSRLRKLLGANALLTRGGGYLLDVEPERVDAHHFERLTDEGRRLLAAGDARAAAERLREALDLWRGPPLADLSYEQFAQGEIARLEELRLAAVEERVEAELALGAHLALVPELENLVREHPTRERLRAQLILALYRSGRQVEALESYRDARRALVEQLGLEPGPELRSLEQAILSQDPELDAPATSPRPATAPRGGRRPGALVLLGGGLLLAAAALAAVMSGGGEDPATTPVPGNSVAVIDPDADRVIATIPAGVQPGDISAGDGQIWVANLADDTTTQVDARRRAVASTTAPGISVAGLAAGLGGVWISDHRRSRLVRLDPAFHAVAQSVRLARRPVVLGLVGPTPVAVGNGSVWVGGADGTVARVDPESGEVARVPVGNSPSAIATGAGSVWVVDDEDNTLSQIDPASANAVVATTPTGRGPTAVAAGAEAVWVANTQDDTAARVDPHTAGVTDTIQVGRRPTGVAVGAGAVWVANSLSGTVTRIDPTTGTVETTIEVGEAPQGVTVADGLVWVSVQERAGAPPPPSGAPGGVARVLAATDPGPTDPALYTDLQLNFATCALLYNLPDRPFPAGARLRPEVAAGPPSVSADGLTYEIAVRRGFRFSPPSNRPVTAAAFERALQRSLNPKMGSYAAELVDDIVGARDYAAGRSRRIAGLSARGQTLTIRLERPAPNLSARLAAPWFCAVPPETPIRSKGVDAVPSAGPYYVASHVPGRSLVLRRNPAYDGHRPHRLAEIRYRLGVPVEKAVAAVEEGRADYVALHPLGLPGASADLVRRLTARYGPLSEAARAGRQQFFAQPAPNIYYFILNTQRGPFADVRLRRAVAHAIDRRALAEHTGLGEPGRPTDQFIPPGLPGFEDAALFPLGGPDLEAARRLAGDARHRAVLYTCNLPGCRRHAEVLRSNLRAMGIELVIRQFPLGELFSRISTPGEPYDIAYSNWYFDHPDPSSYIDLLFGEDAALETPFNDRPMQQRISATSQLSGDARLRAYADLDRDLAAEALPAVPFASGTTDYLLSARMGCQVPHPVYGLDLAALCVRRR